MEQNKNKEASFDCRETKQEETQSAHAAARREREKVLERVRRRKEVCNAYDALCRLLDERKLILEEVRKITIRNIDGEKCAEEALDVFKRWKENTDREVEKLELLTQTKDYDDEEF